MQQTAMRSTAKPTSPKQNIYLAKTKDTGQIHVLFVGRSERLFPRPSNEEERLRLVQESFNQLSRMNNVLSLINYINDSGPLVGVSPFAAGIATEYLYVDDHFYKVRGGLDNYIPITVNDLLDEVYFNSKTPLRVYRRAAEEAVAQYNLPDEATSPNLSLKIMQIEPLLDWFLFRNLLMFFSQLIYELSSGASAYPISALLSHIDDVHQVKRTEFGTFYILQVAKLSRNTAKYVYRNSSLIQLRQDKAAENHYPRNTWIRTSSSVTQINSEENRQRNGFPEQGKIVDAFSAISNIAGELFTQRGIVRPPGDKKQQRRAGETTSQGAVLNIPENYAMRDYLMVPPALSPNSNTGIQSLSSLHLMTANQDYAKEVIGVRGFDDTAVLISIGIEQGVDEVATAAGMIDVLAKTLIGRLVTTNYQSSLSNIIGNNLEYGYAPVSPTSTMAELLMLLVGHKGYLFNRCAYCDRITLAPSVGKPRMFCSVSCRKMYEARKANTEDKTRSEQDEARRELDDKDARARQRLEQVKEDFGTKRES